MYINTVKIAVFIDCAVNNMWIYEKDNWNQFSWNIEKITTKLSSIRYQQGKLFGRMEELLFHFRRQCRTPWDTGSLPVRTAGRVYVSASDVHHRRDPQ